MRMTFLMAGLIFSLIMPASAGPRILSYQGVLFDSSGVAVPDGAYDMRFRLFREETGTVHAWQEVDTAVSVFDGSFSTLLGDRTVFDRQFSNDFSLWLEVAVDLNGNGSFEADEVYAPRQRLAGAAWALEADRLQGHPAADFAATGHQHGWSELSDIPAGFADDVDNDTIGNLSPDPGEVAQWNGSAWEPVSINPFPEAILQAVPANLWPGDRMTTLSLALSRAPGGGPLTYAFDPQGRMVGEPGTFGNNPTATFIYREPGDYLAAGWVRDSAGRVSRAQARVSVLAFRNVVLDSEGDVGQDASLAEVNGRPSVVYFNDTNQDLEYLRANDPFGDSWADPVTVHSGAASVGRNPSLAVVNGRPAVAYYDQSNGDLIYRRSVDRFGNAWPTLVIPDSTGNVGADPSLAVVEGRPAIAYRDSTERDLKYVRSDDADGDSWDTPLTVDNSTNVGLNPSLDVVDDRPAIAYRDQANGDLKYVRASDATGGFWNSAVTVDSEGSVGSHASMAVVDGRPAIAYHDGTSDDLNYVRADDATGGSWPDAVTVDSFGNVGEHASLAVIDGRPAIAYRDNTTGDLNYLRARDSAGNTWGGPIRPDSGPSSGLYASMAVVNGRPAIAYYDFVNNDLRYSFADK